MPYLYLTDMTLDNIEWALLHIIPSCNRQVSEELKATLRIVQKERERK